MRMIDAIALMISAVGTAALAGLLRPALRRYLPGLRGWTVTILVGTALSAASWLVTDERMGGTLLQLRRGWPKSYSFQCIALDCPWSWTFDWMYFLGNCLFYSACMVFAWTIAAALRGLFGDRVC